MNHQLIIVIRKVCWKRVNHKDIESEQICVNERIKRVNHQLIIVIRKVCWKRVNHKNIESAKIPEPNYS